MNEETLNQSVSATQTPTSPIGEQQAVNTAPSETNIDSNNQLGVEKEKKVEVNVATNNTSSENVENRVEETPKQEDLKENLDEKKEETQETEPTTESPSENQEETGENEENVNNEPENLDDKPQFSQNDLNRIINKRLSKAKKDFYKGCGVENETELDAILGKGQAYDIMKNEYDKLVVENTAFREKELFTTNNINPQRYDDIRVHFKGLGTDLNADNLKEQLMTHPEWINKPTTAFEAPTTPIKPKVEIKAVGNPISTKKVESDDSLMRKLWGIE